MLKVTDLSCARDSRPLFTDLSFTLAAGELLQVVGGNGSGKSTLLRLLMGLYSDYRGEISWRLAGAPLYLGHRLGIKTSLTVAENLRWFCVLRDLVPDASLLEDALINLGLQDYAHTLCAHLSEGQRKRVALGQFLLSENPCWIMDEPFSAIDTSGLSFLMNLLETHIDKGGAVIISTHQPITIDRSICTLELK